MNGNIAYTVAPAWWDPKSRTVIFDPGTIVCGMLVVGAGRVVFASPDGIAFDLPAGGLRVTWVKMGLACRLRAARDTYLVYLMPPVDGAPQLSKEALAGIASALTTSGDLAEVAGLAGDLGVLADIAGQSMKTISSVVSMRRARRHRRALEHQFAQLT
jgi:hypothetical protein